jgi:hypothetical protein
MNCEIVDSEVVWWEETTMYEKLLMKML